MHAGLLPHLIFAYTGSMATLAAKLPDDPPTIDFCIYCPRPHQATPPHIHPVS